LCVHDRDTAEQLECTAYDQMRWAVSSEADEVVVALEGEMDLANADAFGRALTAVLEAQPSRVTVDLANLSFLDSTGIRCLVIASREASAMGSQLMVRRARGSVLRVLEITGTDALLLDRSDGLLADGS
jgi:anti-sigma B factor antagonist